MPDYTTDLDYEIRYNPCSTMFDLYHLGQRVDSHLPSYADGEAAMQLHREVRQAHNDAWRAVANPLMVAAQIVRQRYPGATYGRWNDYVTALVTQGEPRALDGDYAVIALGDGFAVHHVLNGALGCHIETIRIPVDEPIAYRLAA